MKKKLLIEFIFELKGNENVVNWYEIEFCEVRIRLMFESIDERIKVVFLKRGIDELYIY